MDRKHVIATLLAIGVTLPLLALPASAGAAPAVDVVEPDAPELPVDLMRPNSAPVEWTCWERSPDWDDVQHPDGTKCVVRIPYIDNRKT